MHKCPIYTSLDDVSLISPSPVLLLCCMMSTANIKYPPAAHPYHNKADHQPVITNVQPRGGATMTVDPENAREGKAERLRGGCIPCPDGSVCWIIPIPCCCCC
ncbi:hypothetical protein F5148DRAFT_1156407 [Russula earlei]|uniref:Uncharacterized protein n=1 Tax=Russula earlei TaxID=71964 RepID=A0ACC0UQQ5_9AGAM|nr:hypothetical protein F5148DRAFT_1156407 [Russula earlei]